MTGAAPVTIALLTYNRQTLLARALASARAQDYPSLEILVLDNASTDGTEALCRAAAAADGRIRYVRHPRNLGAAGNFNAAPALAIGRYFMWLADDDWLTPNYVSVCVERLERDAGLALVAGRAELPDEVPGRRQPPPVNLLDNDPSVRVLNYLWDPGENSVFYGVYRTELVRAAGLKRILAGDWLTVAVAASRGRVMTTDEATLYRSPAGNSLGHRRVVSVLGLPAWHAFSPKLTMAIGIARYFRDEYPFDDLEPAARRRLARRVFLVLAARKRMFRWLLWLLPPPLRPRAARA